MSDDTQCCGNCRFNWHYKKTFGKGDKTSGECHRFPPQHTVVGGVTMKSAFPVVEDDMWCAEWKRRGEGGN